MVKKQNTLFTSRELCARYGVTTRTLLAWVKNRDFPAGDKPVKEYIWSVAKVIAWEKTHMPHLHAETVNVEEEPEQAVHWNKLHRERAVEREYAAAEGDEDERPKRGKSATRSKPRRR